MAATPTYGFPYPGTGDSPHGPNQIQALAVALEAKVTAMDADRVLIKELIKGYAAPAQTASGSLTTGVAVTLMTVAIPDPGFSYYILAGGSIGWAMTNATQPGFLCEGSITIDSATYNTNRLAGGFSPSLSVGAGFNQPTLIVPNKRSDAFTAFVGAHTVRLIVRNSGASQAMTIPASAVDTSLTVRIVPS